MEPVRLFTQRWAHTLSRLPHLYRNGRSWADGRGSACNHTLQGTVSEAENLYVYGIVDAVDLDEETSGVDGSERVYTITHENVAAVISDIDTIDPELTDETVQTHGDVLRVRSR